MAKQVKAWHVRKDLGESMRAHELFMEFCGLGTIRKIPLLVEARMAKGLVTESSHARYRTLLGSLCSRFRWISRARAYDEYLLKLQFKAIDASVKESGPIWAKRIEEYREESYQQSIQLSAKADEMLAWPIAETRVDKLEQITVNGETVEVATHITKLPVKWNRRDAILFKEFADKQRRLALEVPTERKLYNFEFTENDEEARLSKAQGAFQFLLREVDDWLANDPSLTREDVIEAYRQQLAKSFKIQPEMLMLEEGQPPQELEALPLMSLELQ